MEGRQRECYEVDSNMVCSRIEIMIVGNKQVLLTVTATKFSEFIFPTRSLFMAASNSSGSPSSSAVTIPIPGKSILKRPPPTAPSLFSRITRFLPTPNSPQAATGTDDTSKPPKRAHFILPEIAIVYPISSVNPPSTPTLKEEKRAIEVREAERRRRVVRGNASSSATPSSPEVGDADEWWSIDKVESFYRECCAGCDEKPDLAITKAFKVSLFSCYSIPMVQLIAEHTECIPR